VNGAVHKVLCGVLLAFAFGLPISISVAEPLAFLAIGLGVALALRKRRREWAGSPFFWPVLLFVGVALASVAWSVRTEATLAKLHRLLLPFLIFVPMGLVGRWPGPGRRPESTLAMAFVAGAVVLGCYDLVRVPLEVAGGTSLFHTGNMRDPQLYLVALCLLSGALLLGFEPIPRRWLMGALCVLVFGLVIHFKRGVWFSSVLVLGWVTIGSAKRRAAWVVLCIVLVLAFVPQVRTRLDLLKEATSYRAGGRYVLWARVAPQLLTRYPEGMGWKAVTHQDLAQHARYLQPELDHLHNNVLQIALELGWVGLSVWLAWMGVALKTSYESYRTLARRGDPLAWVGLGCLAAFCGILLNGMVENNFGDTEIMMAICFVLGLSNGLWFRCRAPGVEALL